MSLVSSSSTRDCSLWYFSPVAEPRPCSCGTPAQLSRGMWNLPRPGTEPVSPALAGGVLTTGPPGPSWDNFLNAHFHISWGIPVTTYSERCKRMTWHKNLNDLCIDRGLTERKEKGSLPNRLPTVTSISASATFQSINQPINRYRAFSLSQVSRWGLDNEK